MHSLRLTRPLHLAALLLPIALYGTLLVLLTNRLAHDQGPVYALDDVYIHMAMAKNLALHGVWGVTPWETTNASSSPLWVALLAAGFALFGANPWLPLVLATLSSLLAIAVGWRALQPPSLREGQRQEDRLAGALAVALVTAVVAFASLPALTVQGMEHPLHAALLLWAALLLCRLVSGDAPSRPIPFLVLIALLPLLRYESLWLVVLGTMLLALRRRYGLAMLTLLCGLGPVVAFGLWSVGKGQEFLPAAILTKSVGPMLLSGDDPVLILARFTWHPLQRMASQPVLLTLWMAADLILLSRLIELRRRILERRDLVLLGLFAVGAWVHATVGTFGWGARYEAYLIVLGIAAVGGWMLRWRERPAPAGAGPRFWAAATMTALLLAAFVATGMERMLVVTINASVASREVRDRDMVVADFFATAYPRQSVMAMNIGAIVWRGDPHLTDVLALGTVQVLRLFLRGELDAAAIDRIARQRDVKVAAIFDDWFVDWAGGPLGWIAVAEFDPHSNRDLRYRLYVRDPAEAPLLAEKLRAFATPPGFRTTIALLPPWN